MGRGPQRSRAADGHSAPVTHAGTTHPDRFGESNDEDGWGRGGKESRPRKTFDYEYEHRYR